MLGVFREYLDPGITVATDGRPSHPRAVRESGRLYRQVNHAQGFITTEGIHTNRIENLWSYLKQKHRARCGLNKGRIPVFMDEFFRLKKIIKH